MHQPHDPLVGSVIDDRYQILARIGEGGMGVVYKARQTSIDRMVAIKVLNQQMAQDPNWVKRFYNEAKACSQLQHPNTIRMFEFGQARSGQLFMAMEFLDGPALREVMDKGPMHPVRVLKILIQACASLAEAHALGIIHRDIKPDNVFLLNMPGSPDFVKVLDFSVAKLLQGGDQMKTQAGVVFGTPQYMSPEQSRGLPLDARSDLYALGILAYEMLSARVPFNHDNAMMVLQMHLRETPPPLPQNIPPPVQQLVMKILSKDPNQRHQSAGELMQDCQRVQAQLGAPGGPGAHPQGGYGQPSGHAGMPNQGYSGMGGPPRGPQMGGAANMGQPRPQAPANPPANLASDAEAKTVVAGAPVDIQALIAQQQQSPDVQNFIQQQSSSAAKTLIAGSDGHFNMLQGGNSGAAGSGFGGDVDYGGPQQPQQPQQPEDSGPPKTMMLQDTEGIISMAKQQMAQQDARQHQQQQQQQPPFGGMGSTGPVPPNPGGPQEVTTAFWVVSLTIGAMTGIAAYMIIRMLA